ncbi:MAG TPA: hypothetical protein VHD81_06515 [Mycobacteriales bacterium]|nr:hypothetical protein [Mycobacteriales bacterium]
MAVISQGSESSGFSGRLGKLKGAALGSGLGVIVVGVGILLIGIGWNGMAGGGGEINGVPNLNAQLPWLVSGGLLGLAFVVFGSAILVAHNARVDRARLEAKLDEMTAALERSTATQETAVVYKPEPRTAPVLRSAPPAPAEEPAVTVVPAKKAAPAKRAPAKKATAKKAPARTRSSTRR